MHHTKIRWHILSLDVRAKAKRLLRADYPFLMTPPGGARTFLGQANLSDKDRAKIASGNWDRLCAKITR